MTDTVTIPLQMTIGDAGLVVLENIEWWTESSRFVLVRYSREGLMQEYGMRIDLDKRTFLDHFDEPSLDQKLDSLLPEICDIVYAQRSSQSESRGNYRSA